MASNNEEQIIGIKRGRGCLSKGLVMALLLVCAAGVLSLWWSGNLKNRAKELLVDARAEAARLQAEIPEVKPEEDALVPFKAAFAKYAAPTDAALSWNDKDAGRDFKSDAVRKFLESNAECLAAVAKALELPACDYGDDYSKGIQGVKLPSRNENRTLARLLIVSARHNAAEGRAAAALRKLGLALRVADPISTQPALVPRMARCAIETQFAEGLAGVLNDSKPDKGDLAALRKLTSNHAGARGDLAQTFRVEKALMAVTIARAVAGETVLYESSSARDGIDWRVWWWHNSGNFIADMSLMSENQEKAVTAVAQPYPQALLAIRKHVEDIGEAPDWALMSGMALVNPDRSVETDCEAAARLNLAQVLIGLRLHKIANGTYPDKIGVLDKLMGTVPPDPFTGEHFGYHRTAKGCRLWSFGRNCKDDGGKDSDDPKHNGKLDVVMELRQ